MSTLSAWLSVFVGLSVVIGLLCNNQIWCPSKAHSIEIDWLVKKSTATYVLRMSIKSFHLLCHLKQSSSCLQTKRVTLNDLCTSVEMEGFPSICRLVLVNLPVCLCTMNWSGVTSPPTTLSPNPAAALITICSLLQLVTQSTLYNCKLVLHIVGDWIHGE